MTVQCEHCNTPQRYSDISHSRQRLMDLQVLQPHEGVPTPCHHQGGSPATSLPNSPVKTAKTTSPILSPTLMNLPCLLPRAHPQERKPLLLRAQAVSVENTLISVYCLSCRARLSVIFLDPYYHVSPMTCLFLQM